MVLNMRNVLAFDIGGSKLIVGVVDEAANIITKRKHTWTRTDEQGVLDVVVKAGRDMLREFGEQIAAIGVSIPGLCDPKQGVWVESCFSGISGIPVKDIISRELKLPVEIENDVNACALAEKAFGCCKDVSDFLWVTVSNGCGGALFINNKLYRGAEGNAGEMGHVVVEENGGFVCGCGNRGCLEIQAAGPGIVRRYQKKCMDEAVTAAEVAKRARRGDELAIQVYKDEGVYLGRAIAAAVNVVNPSKVVIGGGVSESFDLFEEGLYKTVRERIYKRANKQLKIEKTALGYYASLVGAATLALGKGGH